MANILILGGSGFVGRSLCARLVARWGGGGGVITVPSRRVAQARAIQLLPTVQVVEADVHNDAQLARLVAGRDAVVNLVAQLHGSPEDFKRVHVDLPSKLARACKTAGVRRVVHVSALGASERGPSNYLRSKGAGESALKTASALDLSLLRPSVIFGRDDQFLNLFARLQKVFPVIPLGGAAASFQPVWVEDVAEAIVRCLMDPSTADHTYEAVGPQVFTLAELVRLAGKWSGHPRPVIGLPLGLARLQAAMMELLPGVPLMSRDNVDSMKLPSVATAQWPGLQALGIEPAPLAQVAPLYLGQHSSQGPRRLDVLRGRAGKGDQG
jgi:uncharacterized protein YbjT (DUF2867 family)